MTSPDRLVISLPPRGTRPRWRRLRRGLGWLLLLILGLVGTLAGAVWWTLPAAFANVDLPGLTARVTVTLDEHGIPRIAAKTEADAAMALGWMHARDRLFQMEMMRRGAAGRLSEVAGTATLRSDRFVRTLGLARRAEADLASLPADTRALLDAYAAGVNAWIDAQGRFAAPEFLALGRPEPWRPEHSLLWAKVMGIWLSGNWQSELVQARIAATLPAGRLKDLWPEDTSAGRPDLAGLDPARLGRLTAALPHFPEPGTLPGSASNAWAVAAQRSASGAPLLANDPHLGFQAPILWYLVRIDLADGRMLAGATSPGVPLVVIGRNRDLAWGFTTTQADTQDVFVETLAGDGYETPGGPQPFRVTEEVIRVRGAQPVRLRVRETRHGPVISDLDDSPPAGTVLAVGMANLASDDTAAAGLHALNRAGSVAAAAAAAAAITSPPQNLMVADAAGHIGMYLTGRIPVRRSGDGATPVPGRDGAHDWTGWIPFAALPHVVDPPGGTLANANNRIVPPGSPVFIARDFHPDWRFRRLGELLAARPLHDAAGFAAMQGDTVSLLARDLLGPGALLRAIPRPDGAAGVARDLLLAWDGDMAAARPEPLIFNAWMREVGRRALAAGGVPAGAMAAPAELIRLALAPDGHGAAWCNGDCAALAAAALRDVVAGLAATAGPDPTTWRWGALHVARFEHPLLRFVPGLAGLATLSAGTGGDDWTLSRGGMAGGGATPFAHVHGAGLRLVADLADPNRTLAVIATGQSGHPASGHWGDLFGRWLGGAPATLSAAPAELRGRISLVP